MNGELRYKIAVGLIPKIGPVLTKRLIAYCGSAEGIFRSKRQTLGKIPGIGEKLVDYITRPVDLSVVDAELEFIARHRIRALFYLDEGYPERLRQCEDAPVVLYTRGTAELNRTRVISIVGTRNPTDYGRGVTRELIEELARHYSDVLVVSGLAYGIDICAHKACLKHSIDTAAVLGHGLASLYPSAHREVARQIDEKGMLITEFMHNDKPESANFVKRNRIIAGLADATIVVESGERGGALITADIANSYNRDVLAYPGRVHDKMSAGCNRLIKTNRAALMESLGDLEYLAGWQKKPDPIGIFQRDLFPELSDEEQKVTSLLKNETSLTIDQIALLCDTQVSRISALLLNLEFKGVVKCLPGRVYQLV